MIGALPESIKKRLRFVPRIIRNQMSLRLEKEYYQSAIWSIGHTLLKPLRLVRRREVGQIQRQQHVIDTAVKKLNNRRNILFINSYYPPNDFGGSTKVVARQIAQLKEIVDSDNCLWVLTAAPTELRPFELTLDEIDGVMVLRIGTPLHPRPEWHYRDRLIEALCERIFDATKPNIIHAHSMQRLTTAPLLAAHKLKCPYIITLHDAWWINDEQFRATIEGTKIARVGNDSAAIALYTEGVKAQERLVFLSEVMRHSNELISVSTFQRELYLENGIDSVVIENGIDPVEPPIVHSVSKNIRFLYAGGIAAHKGYHLLKLAFEEGGFANWQGTAVDLSGQVIGSARWGATPIYYRSMIERDEWREFWADIDVVIIPSIVDESYGLLAREAQAAGCAVIVSSSGALPDAVDEGKTGWVFENGDAQSLIKVLRMAESQLPLKFNPADITIPTTKDAAEKLWRIYQTILATTRSTSVGAG